MQEPSNLIFYMLPIFWQFPGDGVVDRGQGYGIISACIDWNDALSMYSATHYPFP